MAGMLFERNIDGDLIGETLLGIALLKFT